MGYGTSSLIGAAAMAQQPERDQSAADMALSRLQERISYLHNTVSNLDARLNVVMRPAAPQAVTKPGNEVSPSRASMVETIDHAGIAVHGAIEHLQSLLERLDI